MVAHVAVDSVFNEIVAAGLNNTFHFDALSVKRRQTLVYNLVSLFFVPVSILLFLLFSQTFLLTSPLFPVNLGYG